MGNSEQLSALIGHIYDAALDEGHWPNVLELAAGFVQGPAASVFYKDATSKTGGAAYSWGIEPAYVHTYFTEYIKLDAATSAHYFAEVEQPVASADFIARDELLETRFYREWAQPQGFVDFVASVLDKGTTSAALFGVFRHERDGPANDETRRRMRLIVPHIRRSVMIGRLIDVKSATAASLTDTLDGLTAGMFLLDVSGRIIHANIAGHVLLEAAEVLRSDGGRLVAREPAADAILRESIAAAGEGDASLGLKGIAVPLKARDGARFVAHVLPLTSGARRKVRALHTASVALFVHSANLELASPPELIARAYSLTPSELRVMLAVVEVGGVPEVASALGVAESTVKTHLIRLFAKTGAARQADLVKIVAGYSQAPVNSA